MRKQSARQKALEFLRKLIDQHRNASESRLPNLKELSSMAGVAQTTMLKAIDKMRQQGLITVSHGRGIHVVPNVTDRKHSVIATTKNRHGGTTKWKGLSFLLEQDIICGIYPAGSVLPTTKELCVAYGVCYRTLQKALRYLETHKFLEPYKRHYRVPDRYRSSSYASIVLILAGDEFGKPYLLTQRGQEYIRALQSECAQKKLHLIVATYDPERDAIRFEKEWDNFLLNDRGVMAVLGFFIFSIGLQLPFQFTTLVPRLTRFKKPIAFLDETGIADRLLSEPYMQNRCIQVFSLGNSAKPGYDVGQYLINKGHKRVAYIAPFHKARWSYNRYDGLTRAFKSIGLFNGTTLFTDETLFEGDQLPECTSEERGVIDTAIQSIFTVKSRLPWLLPHTESQLRRNAESIVRRYHLCEQIDRLLSLAYNDGHITAWVAENDNVALECLRFIYHKIKFSTHSGKTKQHVPAVIGFDDTLDAFCHDLTSYNFNGPAVMRAMLNHICNYRPTRRMVRESIEIQGFVTERGTSTPGWLK